MKKQEIIAVILVIISTFVIVGAIFAYKSINEQNTVSLIAQAPEKGNFSPRTITLKKGENVTLLLKNRDVVSHGFYVPGLNLVVKELKAGEVKRLNFTVHESGEYPFYCIVWCSDYHMQMRGKIIVN